MTLAFLLKASFAAVIAKPGANTLAEDFFYLPLLQSNELVFIELLFNGVMRF